MRYRVVHDIIGVRSDVVGGERRHSGPWGKGEEVEADELGSEEDVQRLLSLGAIEEVLVPLSEVGRRRRPKVEKPLAPPPPRVVKEAEGEAKE